MVNRDNLIMIANNFQYKKINHPKYKYELISDCLTWTKLRPTQNLKGRFYSIYKSGKLIAKKGYRWDGASGPTIDTKNVIYASLIHDILYQMFRENQLNRYTWKDQADRELQRIMIEHTNKDRTEDSLCSWCRTTWIEFRAGYYYYAVKYFGHRASGGNITDIFNMDKFKKAA